VQELARAGARPTRFVLTDLHPQLTAWQSLRARFADTIDYVAAPVDATCIPPALGHGRARVIINAFHHFPPPIAQRILADAVRGADGILIAEALERTFISFAACAARSPTALFAAPLLAQRNRLAKALLTWATPVALATSIWDGVVSSLRIYTAEELQALVRPLGSGFYGVRRRRP
jgi:hypothetical protein